MNHAPDASPDANPVARIDAASDARRGCMASGASIPPGFTRGIDASRAVRPGFGARPDAPSDTASDTGCRRGPDARPDARIDASGARATAEAVIAALEEAGLTLLTLPQTGFSTRLRQSSLEWVRDAAQALPPDRTRIRPAVPSAAAIDRMDRVLAWIPRIPADKFVLRRVVGARCLISPMTGRHLYSWRRLGTAIGADHKAVQRWHAQGIGLIVAALNAR